VLSVSSLFLMQVGAYMGVCVCIAYTHTLHMRYLDVSPGVGTRHIESPKNPDLLNFGICVFVYVYNEHMYMCRLGGWMRSWTNFFLSVTYFVFQKRKAKDVNVIPISQIQK